MSAPFRSDLDAARARADVLEEENEELREEVLRLRVAVPVRRGDAPAADPAIAELSEQTLERLDEMTHEIEAVEAPLLEPLQPLPPFAAREHEAPAPAQIAADIELLRVRAELERTVAERDLARAARVAARPLSGLALFALGLLVGLLACAVLVSLR